MRISSTRNSIVAFLRSLDRVSIRRQEGLYLAEGVRLVSEALTSGQSAAVALYDPEMLTRSAAGSLLLERLPHWAETRWETDGRVLAAASQTENSAGVLVALRSQEPPPLASQESRRFGLLLDGLADPGNAGAILRTADAVGADYVLAASGSVDLFAPKVVRAGMGAHFRLRLYTCVTWREMDDALPPDIFVAADARSATTIYDAVWPEPAILIIGNEASGLSEQADMRVRFRVRIPMRPGVESLNASVAASVIMYHFLGRGIESVG